MNLGLPVHDLALFVGAALLLNLTPGPDMLYVAGTAAARGRLAGVLAALGVGAGCVFHTLLAALGVSALIAASDLAFTALKWAGAAYLVGSGLVMLRARPAGDAAAVEPKRSGHPFWQGAFINALNPKVALFFLAFLPQFSDPAQGSLTLQMLALGLVFIAQTIVIFGSLALAAGSIGGLLSRHPQLGPWIDRLCGLLFVGLALRLAADD